VDQLHCRGLTVVFDRARIVGVVEVAAEEAEPKSQVDFAVTKASTLIAVGVPILWSSSHESSSVFNGGII
jgi:hypothetical protein